nr:hypothetical protein [Paenibacillus camerounensis]
MSICDFQVNTISGKTIELSTSQGKALLIVNTASMCSYYKVFDRPERTNT